MIATGNPYVYCLRQIINEEESIMAQATTLDESYIMKDADIGEGSNMRFIMEKPTKKEPVS